MENKTVQGILTLLAVTALSFGVVLGTKALTQGIEAEKQYTGTGEENKITEEWDTAGANGIVRAGQTADGTYLITSSAQGYGGEIVVDILFDENKEKILDITITEQNETEGVGSKVVQDSFLDQFSEVKAPVFLSGMQNSSGIDQSLENAVLVDGTYEKSWESADENGFTDHVKVVIKDGKIQDVIWDSVSEDGKSKSKMSEEGTYTMTEDGLTWAKQAEALGNAVVEDQSLKRIQPDYTGKIDTIAGVSISVSHFASLTRSCLFEAAQMEENTSADAQDSQGTQVDGVSGATVSSTAVVTAVNQAWEFLMAKQ